MAAAVTAGVLLGCSGPGVRACDDCRILRTTLARGEEGVALYATSVAYGGGLRLEADTSGGVLRLPRAAADAGVLRVAGADGAAVDSLPLPRDARVADVAVLRWPDRLLLAGSAAGRAGLFRAMVLDGRVVLDRTFEPPARPRWVRSPLYRLAPAGGGGAWAVEAKSYTVLRYDVEGEKVRSRVRRPGWFARPARRPDGRVMSSVRAVAEDSAGRLWVFSLVGNEQAGAAWRAPEARRAGGTMQHPVERLYDTYVEVLDTANLSLVAAGRIRGYVERVGADGTAVFRFPSANGTAEPAIQRLWLAGGR